MKHIFLLALALIFFIVGVVPTDLIQRYQPGLASVITVDDGDTIIVRVGRSTEKVRFIGVDTPESKDPRKPVQCFSAEASRISSAKLNNTRVRLVADPLGDNRDKYGRLLRYVFLQDGTLINSWLIRQGYGFAYTIFPYTKLPQFSRDEDRAHAQKRGLWSGCMIDSTSRIKQTVWP